MANYNDGIGNYFAGKLSFSGNTLISDATNFSTDLSAILTNSNAKFRNLPSNAEFADLSLILNIHFGANLDTIDDRGLIVTGANILSATNDQRVFLFNDSGSTIVTTTNITAGSTNLTNQIYKRQTQMTSNWIGNISNSYYTAVTDGNSLGIVQFTEATRFTNVICKELKFWYCGMLNNPSGALNTNSKKYITLVAHRQVRWNTIAQDQQQFQRTRAYLDNELFSNTSASYTFTCANLTVPTKQWTKPFEVKNGSTVYGTARNLLHGLGSFPLLIPVTVPGSGGGEKWLPVCHYNDPYASANTLLLRCNF